MKNVYVVFLALLSIGFARGQVLNEPAGWPNSSWTVVGTYDVGSVLSDPTTTSSFGFDSDDAGSGSHNIIAAESPVIDLTAAYAAGETWLEVSLDLVFYASSAEMGVEFYDADADTWNLAFSYDGNSTSSSDYVNCSNFVPTVGGVINIASFTPTQLAGFKYRIGYDDNNTWSWGFCASNVTIYSVQPPACPDPSMLASSNETGSTAEISWIEDGAATSWNVEYGAVGFTPGMGTGTVVVAGNNPYVLTGLTPVTEYDVYIQSDCGADQSNWVGPISVETGCATYVPDYIQGFDTYLPDCWSEGTGTVISSGPTGTFSGWSGTSSGFGGNEARVNVYGTTRDEWLVSPVFDLAGGGYEVSFDVAVTDYYSLDPSPMGADDTLRLMFTEDGSSWVSMAHWTVDDNIPNVLTTITLPVASVSPQAKFALYASSGTANDPEDYYIYIDNFKVRTPPSCAEVSSISVANETQSTVDITWVDNAGASTWVIEYGEAGFTQGVDGTYESVSTTTYTLSGLDPSTEYEFYVLTECGASGSSIWVGPNSFTTACGIEIPDYLQSFDTYLPNCWSEGTGVDLVNGPVGTTSSWREEDVFGQNTAAVNVWSTYTDEWLVTPQFDLSAGGYEVSFDMALTAYNSTSATTFGSDDSLRLMISEDGVTWQVMDAWDVNSNLSNNLSNFRIPLASVSPQARFAFFATSGDVNDNLDNDIHIDNFQVRTPPVCLEVTSVDVQNVTGQSADIVWVDQGTASSWVVEWGEQGFTQGDGTYESVSTESVSLSGLDPTTTYEFYVLAECGANGTSVWVGPISFTTACATVIPYYAHDFSTFPGDCWAEATDGYPNQGPQGIGNSSWYGTATLGSSARINLYSTGKHDWLVSPIFDLSASNYQLTIDVAVTNFYSSTPDVMGSDDTVAVYITEDGWQTFEEVAFWTVDDNLSNSLTKFIYDLTSAGTSVQFGIYATEGVLDDTEDYDFHVSNFVVRETPTCLEPISLAVSNITGESAELSWTEGTSATTWEIEYGESGFVQGSVDGTILTGVTDNPYLLSGLLETTDYEFYVRADCGAGDFSEWSGPFEFTTLELCPEVTEINFISSDLTVIDIDWGVVGTATSYNVEYGPTGFTQGTGTVESGITMNSHSITGLTAGTSYDIYVQANCDATSSQSEWFGPLNASTACDVFTPYYINDFATFPGDCWTEADNGTPQTGPTDFGSSFWKFGDEIGTTARINLYTNTRKDWLISPEFNLSGGNYELLLDVAVTNWNSATADVMGSDDSVAVYFSEDGGVTMQRLGFWTAADNLANTLSTFTFSVPSNGTNVVFGIYATDGTVDDTEDYDFHVSNFIIQEVIVPCSDPVSLTVSNITHTSADLSWTETGSATQWDIEWGPVGFTPGSGTPVLGLTSPIYNLTGLTQDTEYEFYVRANCGVDGTSAFVGPEGWTTTVEPCADVDGVYATNVAYNSAEIGWIENGSATSWEIEYGETGFAQGTGTTVQVNTNPYELTGLLEETIYDVYVRAVCTSTESNWSAVFSFETENTASIGNEELAKNVTVYPNPSNGEFTLTIPTGTYATAELSVLDVQGKVVFNKNISGNNSEVEVRLPRDTKPGVYLIKVDLDGVVITKRLEVK